MRTSFTVAALVAAAATFSSAAVVPRANLNHGLETRYYRDAIYARAIPENKGSRRIYRRSHPREFHKKRLV